MFAVPNGGLRDVRVAAKMTKEGVRPGVADLCVLLPKGKTLWVEVKRPMGKQTQHQKDFEKKCKDLGHAYVVVHSLEDFIQVLRGNL